jgi:hypothetical protein
VPARPWRWLALPVALLIAATVLVGLLRSELRSAGGRPPAQATRGAPARHVRHHAAAPRFYTVRAGDTLATIAAATHVPVSRLQRLNPKLEPTSLFIGDHVRLR